MKKLVKLLAIVCAVCCLIGLVACDKNTTVEVTDITLFPSELTLTEGETEILGATITPSNATDQTLNWTSSDTSIATVEYGSVIAIAEGEATITVSSSNGLTATCVVTVKAEEPEPPTQYTVTFYANGGEFENGNDTLKVLVNEDEKLQSETVTRGDKYLFTNWYKDEYLTKLWDFDTDLVTENTKLFAGWKYLNKYQSVMDALSARIKTERHNNNLNVEILSIFTDNGYLCFVEKDSTGVFSYKTDICDFDYIINNDVLISKIPNTALTQLKAYNDTYTSDNNALIADCMGWKYTSAANSNEAVIYSCVSEWELNTDHFTTNGPWYSCKVNAIMVDDEGHVFDCSFSVISGFAIFDKVIGGTVLSEEFDLIETKLGETADDFYTEYLKELEA